MIKVSLENIQDLDLPLDTAEKIIKRGDEKKKIKGLEKRYNAKSHLVFRKCFDTYLIYANGIYANIPEHTKKYWLDTYRDYVASSFQYKMWIFFKQYLF